MSARNAARQFGVPSRTIDRKVRIKLDGGDPAKVVNGGFKPVFTEDEEQQLQLYLEEASSRLLGLCRPELRSLAFDFAKRLQKPNKFNKDVQKAGYFWVRNFIKRNNSITFRSPQSTSMYRAKSFTREKVNIFFDNVEHVMKSKNFTPDCIYNMDETGFNICHKPLPVIAKRGAKYVGRISSGERGRLITAMICCNAAGIFIPPFLVFPGKQFLPRMLADAPDEAVGTCTKSGWSNQEVFLKWLDHFVKYASPSSEKPVLLILDNHTSHVTYEAIQLCTTSDVTMVSLPPHTSHKLQPLDVAVFGPFKRGLRTAQHMWLSRHAPSVITETILPRLFTEAYMMSAKKEHAIAGFRASGICPFNRDIFTSKDYAPAQVFGELTSNLAEPCDEHEGHDDDEGHVYESQGATASSNNEDQPITEIYEPNFQTDIDNLQNESEGNTCQNTPSDAGQDNNAQNQSSMTMFNEMGTHSDDVGQLPNVEKELELIRKEKELIAREKDLLMKEKALLLKERELMGNVSGLSMNAVATAGCSYSTSSKRQSNKDRTSTIKSSRILRRAIQRKPSVVYFSDLDPSKITPHSLRPLPTARQLQARKGGRQAGKSEILTSESVKNRLASRKNQSNSTQ